MVRIILRKDTRTGGEKSHKGEHQRIHLSSGKLRFFYRTCVEQSHSREIKTSR